MKYFFYSLLFLSIVLLPISAFALGWHLQYQDPSQRTLFAVKFVDSLNGWVVGDSGVILHTSNGGANWNTQTSTTLHVLRGVSFTDVSHGCAVGDSGSIFHTNNGGSDWSTQTSGTTRILRSVSFVDSLHGWVVGDSGLILHTNNAGTSWNLQTSGTAYALNSVCFVDSSHGWAVGGTYVFPDTSTMRSVIVNTNNGGLTWGTQNSDTNIQLNGVSFADTNHGCIVGGGSHYNYSIIEYSTNRGMTWTFPQYFANSFPFQSVVDIDSNHAWSVLGYFRTDLHVSFGGACYSSNGGSDWFVSIDLVPPLFGISATDSTHIWAVGDSGVVYLGSGYTGVEEKPSHELPNKFNLYQNYPNPFNSTTTISYHLPKFGAVKLQLFDITGREVKTLFNGRQQPGNYHVSFEAKALPSGIYLYRLSSGNQNETRKMILLK